MALFWLLFSPSSLTLFLCFSGQSIRETFVSLPSFPSPFILAVINVLSVRVHTTYCSLACTVPYMYCTVLCIDSFAFSKEYISIC